MLPDSREPKLGSSHEQASQSTGKNTGVVLVPCRSLKCVLTAISSGVDISEDPGCHLHIVHLTTYFSSSDWPTLDFLLTDVTNVL